MNLANRSVKALAWAFAVEIVIIGLGLILFAWVGNAFFLGALHAGGAFQIILASAVTVLFAPAFLAGYLAREHGFLLGVAAVLLPVVVAAVALGLGAYLLLGICAGLSGLSGVAGQSFARWRHAP